VIPVQPIVPAQPAFLPDGSLYSPEFEDIYASKAGALEQAAHVFLGGNGLPERWRSRRNFVIVETGFGAGLNFLATWAAWRETAAPGARLHFISAEKHPFRRADLRRVLGAWPALTPLAGSLIGAYPALIPGFHRVHFDAGSVTLTLLLGEAADSLRQLEARVDAFYLDGFAPSKNPAMWSDGVWRELGRLAGPDATAATYTVAGVVREGLDAAGFSVERRAGFGPKREMLVARFARGRAEAAGGAPENAIVIGAGLAGTTCAAHLAERGWTVDLIERHGAPAQEASGNAAGVLMPAFSADWNPPTRLTAQSCLYALRSLETLSRGGHGPVWERSGVLQLSREDAHFERQRRIVEAFALSDEMAQLVDPEQAAAIAGAAVAGPGWWLPKAGWADPASVCRAHLAVAGSAVRASFNAQAAQLREAGDAWEVLDGAGKVLARGRVIVLANALGARALSGFESLPLASTRGQVTLLPAQSGGSLRVPVCREGYITPAVDGVHCVGASYDLHNRDLLPTLEDHAGNLARLERLLPGFGAGVDARALDGRVGFRTISPDRMPLVGSLSATGMHEGRAGLFACLALASRGLTWAPLLGETVACLVGGEPLPIERDLLGWVDPRRFPPAQLQQRARSW
jgi:tRNA 5-methylaminomethyl-2-thiouridine biosynthesis bifunctional protein